MEHLLLSCKQTEITQARAKLQDEMKGLRLSLRLLIHMKIRIGKILSFLKETRLYTRKWLLERGQEEAEEIGEIGEVGEE